MTLSKKAERWLRLILVGGSFLVSLSLAELLLRVFPPQEDLATIYQMERIPETMLMAKYDPKVGFRMEPNTTLRYRSSELRFTIATDGQGYRKLTQTANGEPLVLFVGDSFVWGTGVEASETVAARFAELAHLASPVLPLAAPGWSSGQEMLALESYLDAGDKPSLAVFLFYLDNDLHENISPSPIYPRFYLSSNGTLQWQLSEGGPQAVSLLRDYGGKGLGDWSLFWSTARWGILDRLLSRSRVWIRLRNTILNRHFWRSKDRARQELNYELTIEAKIMNRVAADLNAKSIDFVFCDIPPYAAVISGHDEVNDWFERECAAEGYHCLNLLESLLKLSVNERKKLYFPLDRHWTAAGHRFGAQTLYSHYRGFFPRNNPAANRVLGTDVTAVKTP
jgi:hypothetical protein